MNEERHQKQPNPNPLPHGGGFGEAAPDITLLLQSPNAQSINDLLPLVYNQLRAAAEIQMTNERNAGGGHTLSATALVHEAYLKLVGPRELPWQNRGHFYAAAAEAMRRILIDRARVKFGRLSVASPPQASAESPILVSPRARQAALSLAGLESLAANETEETAEGLLALDASLAKLDAADPQAASIVRLRFFAGLDVESTALSLGLSARTVKRDWAFAKAWLRSDLERVNEP